MSLSKTVQQLFQFFSKTLSVFHKKINVSKNFYFYFLNYFFKSQFHVFIKKSIDSKNYFTKFFKLFDYLLFETDLILQRVCATSSVHLYA
jgi:hypothetical protein